jgi:hypothetical protein
MSLSQRFDVELSTFTCASDADARSSFHPGASSIGVEVSCWVPDKFLRFPRSSICNKESSFCFRGKQLERTYLWVIVMHRAFQKSHDEHNSIQF